MKKAFLLFILALLTLFGCIKPDFVELVKKEYDVGLKLIFNTESWLDLGNGVVEYKGRLKPGLLLKIMDVDETNFPDDRVVLIYKSEKFRKKLSEYFGTNIVYDMFSMDACKLNPQLDNKYANSGLEVHHTYEDLSNIIEAQEDVTEMRKAVLFVLSQSERRVYNPGSLITVVFDISDVQNIKIDKVLYRSTSFEGNTDVIDLLEKYRTK